MRRKFTGTTSGLKDLKAVEGVYQGSREVPLADGGSSLVHKFETADGESVEVWGFGQLDFALSKLVGKYVWIKYTGMQQRKTRFGLREVHTCDVDYDDGEPSAPQPAPVQKARRRVAKQ
jgi:hypothetical protein